MSLPNYETVRKLGQGTYGSVFLCRQKSSGRQCVMKRLQLNALNEKERRSAIQEANLLRQLNHPNVVAYVDMHATRSKLFIFMQYCDGGDLEQSLHAARKQGRHMSEQQLLDWFVQMSLALQYLHSRRVLHRDLKTANVFLTRANIVKLGDLGVARVCAWPAPTAPPSRSLLVGCCGRRTPAASPTHPLHVPTRPHPCRTGCTQVLSATAELAKTFVGTPYYLSPELLSSQPYGPPADVWALGCIFYEIATLDHPFDANNFPMLANKIVSTEPEPIAYKRPPSAGGDVHSERSTRRRRLLILSALLFLHARPHAALIPPLALPTLLSLPISSASSLAQRLSPSVLPSNRRSSPPHALAHSCRRPLTRPSRRLQALRNSLRP